MKPVLDILSSLSKLAFGEKQALAAPAPIVSSSVVNSNDDLMTVLTILMAVALIAVSFALILSLTRQISR
jgi:hypothetical protein